MPTTNALWEKNVKKTITYIKPVLGINTHGKRIKCLNDCGNMVLKSKGICRSCRRKGRRIKEKVEYRLRKDNNKQKDLA